MTWAAVVRTMCEARDMSLRKAAAAAGVPVSTVLGWVSEGKVPGVDAAEALLLALDATPEERQAAHAALLGCAPDELGARVGLAAGGAV
jgi:hypothetical protein